MDLAKVFLLSSVFTDRSFISRGHQVFSAPYGPWAEWQINPSKYLSFQFVQFSATYPCYKDNHRWALEEKKKTWWSTAYTWQIKIEYSEISKKKTIPAPPGSRSSPQSWMCSGVPQRTCLFLRIEFFNRLANFQELISSTDLLIFKICQFSNQSPPLTLLARALQVRSKRPWWWNQCERMEYPDAKGTLMSR